MSGSRSARTRKTWLAVGLCLIGSPFVSMLYLGRGWRALAYLAGIIVSLVVVYALSVKGSWPAGWSWTVPVYLLTFVGAVDSWRISSALGKRFDGPWFSTWQSLVGFAVAFGLVSIGARTFLYEPFRVPAGSMLPTLASGDHFFVNKFAYGLRLPFTAIELTSGEIPQRGDVVVFRAGSERINYVKRIIGVPGDIVSIDGVSDELTINGQPVPVVRLGRLEDAPEFERARERIGDREHEMLISAARNSIGGTYRVPEGHYFVLGDNRDNSLDSRFDRIGFVAKEDILGRASLIWWNIDAPERAGQFL